MSAEDRVKEKRKTSKGGRRRGAKESQQRREGVEKRKIS